MILGSTGFKKAGDVWKSLLHEQNEWMVSPPAESFPFDIVRTPDGNLKENNCPQLIDD